MLAAGGTFRLRTDSVGATEDAPKPDLKGIAGRLLKHLARIAREQGVDQFEADVLPQNKAMLAVFARSGLPLKQVPAEGSIHVTLSLTGRA